MTDSYLSRLSSIIFGFMGLNLILCTVQRIRLFQNQSLFTPKSIRLSRNKRTMVPIKIIEKYYNPESKAYHLLVHHSKMVTEKALEIAKKVEYLNLLPFSVK